MGIRREPRECNKSWKDGNKASTTREKAPPNKKASPKKKASPEVNRYQITVITTSYSSSKINSPSTSNPPSAATLNSTQATNLDPLPTASDSPGSSPDEFKSFLEYSGDLENDLLTMNVIDLNNTMTTNILQQYHQWVRPWGLSSLWRMSKPPEKNSWLPTHSFYNQEVAYELYRAFWQFLRSLPAQWLRIHTWHCFSFFEIMWKSHESYLPNLEGTYCYYLVFISNN